MSLPPEIEDLNWRRYGNPRPTKRERQSMDAAEKYEAKHYNLGPRIRRRHRKQY